MKSQSKTRIGHCYLVSNESRDFYILLPIIYYLEKFENFKIEFKFVWDAHLIKKESPELVILPNVRGHNLYYEIGKYCSDNDILVFNHDSEGNFNTKINYDYWGFNLSKKNFCPILFTWNHRVKDFLVDKYNLDPNSILVSGGPGFDRYKYLPAPDKKAILAKYGKSDYKLVVGYAGWAFGKIFNSDNKNSNNQLSPYFQERREWMIEQRDLVEGMLKYAIENNPETLFILKKHPRENFESESIDSRNEINQITNYPNVLYLKDEEEINELIHISDLWTAFESTSIMEAWLTDRPTLMLNPDVDFRRANTYLGSKIAKSKEEFHEAIDELRNKNLAYFSPQDVLERRQTIISESIGFEDGLNHIRCMEAFIPLLRAYSPPTKKAQTSSTFLKRYILLHFGKIFYNKAIFSVLPKFKKTVWLFENRKLSKIKADKDRLKPYLDKYYEKEEVRTRIKSI